MIFVSVGTHEQQFNRLVKAVDELVSDGVITEKVFIQTGYSEYEPAYCEWSKFVPASRMAELMSEANVIITHGGPSSFIEAMAAGKVPVVVPRRAEFGEHVNNHQVDFVIAVADRQGGIIPCLEVDHLSDCIERARVASSTQGYHSHNSVFCAGLEKVLKGL